MGLAPRIRRPRFGLCADGAGSDQRSRSCGRCAAAGERIVGPEEDKGHLEPLAPSMMLSEWGARVGSWKVGDNGWTHPGRVWSDFHQLPPGGDGLPGRLAVRPAG